MIVDINKVEATDRIRKDFGDIEELAESIKEIGLLNPPVVTPEMQLIAGERRLRACKHLGWQQIEVRVMTVRDFEQQLRMEIDENENRKDFTFTERLDWARRLERVEREKARERQGERTDLTSVKTLSEVRSDEVVAEDSGFGSREQYRKAKFIDDNADAEIIAKLDAEKISIHKAWTETKAKLAAEEAEKERLANENTKLRDDLLHAKIPKVVEKEVVKEVVPTDVAHRIKEAEQKMREAERDRDAIQASLADTYEELQRYQKRERATKMQHESPLYDVYRSLTASNGHLKALVDVGGFLDEVVKEADVSLRDRLGAEVKQVLHNLRELERVIDAKSNVVVIDAE